MAHRGKANPRQMARDHRKQEKYRGGHHATRQMLDPYVRAGLADCVRCGEPIAPGEAWDLGHDDLYPHLHSGPEHVRCNRGAPHRNVTSRDWFSAA